MRKYCQGTDLLKEKSLVDAVAIDQWMEVEMQQFNGPTSALVFQHLILPTFYGSTADEKVVAEELEKLEKVLDVYEAKLSKTKFLAGDFYSLADLHHLTYGYYLITGTPHGTLISSRPHVKAWWDTIYSRPASKKVTTAMSLTRSAAN